MSFFERSSSVLTLSPQPVHGAHPFSRMTSPVNAFNRFQSPPNRLGALSGNRKRSRDDEDDEEQQTDSQMRPRRIAGAVGAKRVIMMPTSQSTPAFGSAQMNQPIDELTLHLGIGWRRLSSDEHLRAAARGWTRYIELHYPLTNVNITLESKSLQSYLVESNEGFFLFSENLRQGRLVSRTRDGVLANLKTNPPAFDSSSYVMHASVTAKVQTPVQQNGMQVC
ncbi:hypothetical protein BROUX41_000416 [Berkeleyomyces rouxiae]|uniref:uncharacterized protein n=1 Tax=Berkeleyomyces rouxiae TaxID=2035830 RepID=UPI003B8162C0